MIEHMVRNAPKQKSLSLDSFRLNPKKPIPTVQAIPTDNPSIS